MKYLAFGLVAVVVLVAVVGCGSGTSGATSSKGKFGQAIPVDMAMTPAKDVLAAPKDFEGKDVLVKGKITSECPSGGWVWLQDGSDQIYVNMHRTNVFIPQKVGSTVRAMGKVVLEQGRPQVEAIGLEF